MSQPPELPAWSRRMRDLFRSGSVAQFILHGNVFDLVPLGDRLVSLKVFLDEAMFAGYDTVLHYDRSRGVRATKGQDDWSAWLRQALGDANPISSTREPGVALELIDRYLLRSLNLQAIQQKAQGAEAPADKGARARKIAVVIDFAEFVVPRGDALQLGGPFAANVVKVLGLGQRPGDPAGQHRHRAAGRGTARPERAGLREPARRRHSPAAAERSRDGRPISRRCRARSFPTSSPRAICRSPVLAQRLTGLSRVGAQRLATMAVRSGQRLTPSG